MSEIQHYQGGVVAAPQPQRPIQTSGALDSWVGVMSDVVRLSEYICQTEFVPEAMRNKPAAVAAAMLTGREMGIEPMMALRHIHVVKGKPGLSAELMRAQVQAAGHEIDFVEATDTRCVMQGRRRGESDWTRVTFTADQARKARIDLGGYPEDKLIARATTRLCRRKFADVVAGLSSVDELEDADIAAGSADESAKPQQRRTAQRKPAAAPARPRQPQASISVREAQQPDSVSETSAGPPLPGEDGYEDTSAASDAIPAPASEPTSTADEPEPMITRDQASKLHTTFTRAGYTGQGSRSDRLRVASEIVGRQLDSSNDLTKAEASTLIDTLEMVAERGELADDVDVLLAAVQSARQEKSDEQALIAEYEAEQQATDPDALHDAAVDEQLGVIPGG